MDSTCDVLIVDDDVDVRAAMLAALGLEQLRVECADNGIDALAKLRRGLRPRVILLDLMMPDMNGWQFRAAQLADPAIAAIPVVVVSAGDGVVSIGGQLGVAGALRKPIELEDLIQTVDRFRAQPAQPAAP